MQRPARRFMLMVCALLLIISSAAGLTAAQGSQPVLQTCPHGLRPGVPFIWLRDRPASGSLVMLTLWPGQTVTLTSLSALHWDGIQWWVWAWPNVPGVHGYYWVEVDSLIPQCQITTTPPPGLAAWLPNQLVRVKLSVPFVWFRAVPRPGDQPRYTVMPGTELIIVEGGRLDSYNQYWWKVRDPRSGQVGWVEQEMLEPSPASVNPIILPVNWLPGDTVRVRARVPFSWLRQLPGSPVILYTARPRQRLIVQQGPIFDAAQTWWLVAVPNTNIVGWVEETSLEFVRR